MAGVLKRALADLPEGGPISAVCAAASERGGAGRRWRGRDGRGGGGAAVGGGDKRSAAETEVR